MVFKYENYWSDVELRFSSSRWACYKLTVAFVTTSDSWFVATQPRSLSLATDSSVQRYIRSADLKREECMREYFVVCIVRFYITGRCCVQVGVSLASLPFKTPHVAQRISFASHKSSHHWCIDAIVNSFRALFAEIYIYRITVCI